jgi:DNA-binding IclR family transcriptional regulator
MGRDGLSVVERAARVLDVFSRSGKASLGFNELLEGAGMSRATTHRVLTDMVEHGFLQQPDHREQYKLGPLMLSTAVLAAKHASARDAALPRMERLRDRCGETVVLTELHGDSVVPVARADGLHEIRMNQEVGRRYPAYAGGTGKVLLAYLAPDELDAYLSRVRFEPLTPRTVTSATALKQELDEIREVGVGVTAGERVPEGVALAAPIFSSTGRIEAALTISGVASRATAEQAVEDAVRVRVTADEISSALGGSPPAPDGRTLQNKRSEARKLLTAIAERAMEPAGEPVAATV